MGETAMRSILFVPGNRQQRFQKACESGADAYCIDLEDAVPAAEKEEARNAALAHIVATAPDNCCLRINSLSTKAGLEDLLGLSLLLERENVLPACIILPMAVSAFEIRQLIRVLDYHPALRLIPMVETPEGLDNLPAILEEGRGHIEAIAFGSADYAASTGSNMGWDALLSARSSMVKSAAGYSVQCIDGPHFDIPDVAGLEKQASRVFELGFSGKLAIHPSQVETINLVFAPSKEKISWARGVIEAFEKAGGGVVSFDGMMIDQPVVDQAKRLLASAE
jgi:citrate lyase subunit beta/citryl-CoA lyase/(S)-citramalyl-CoA lyase